MQIWESHITTMIVLHGAAIMSAQGYSADGHGQFEITLESCPDLNGLKKKLEALLTEVAEVITSPKTKGAIDEQYACTTN